MCLHGLRGALSRSHDRGAGVCRGAPPRGARRVCTPARDLPTVRYVLPPAPKRPGERRVEGERFMRQGALLVRQGQRRVFASRMSNTCSEFLAKTGRPSTHVFALDLSACGFLVKSSSKPSNARYPKILGAARKYKDCLLTPFSEVRHQVVH